jgi:isopentenyl-diphosphate delta-isomerase type 1
MQKPPIAQRDDEIFDIVDAQDRVIGQGTRRDVHAQELWHRAVHVLVFDSRGRVFLQKRSMAKDTSPGCWDSSCSGHVDAGEDYLTAAVRELQEEIGVAASPEQLVFRLRLGAEADTGWEFVSVYTLRYDGPIVIHPAEIERGEWFEPKDVTQKISERPSEFTQNLQKHWTAVEALMRNSE